MINESYLIVRASGLKENYFYIDYLGTYQVEDISKLIGVKPSVVKDRYVTNGGEYDSSQNVYYFDSPEHAQKAIAEILNAAKPEAKGRNIVLTESEIEYIRKALINEGVNTIHLNSKIKDNIFKKLNG